MKCKNCGASVPSRLPACEYCGTANEVYIRRKQELDLLKNIFNKARRRAIIETVPNVVIRVLNRFIFIAAMMLLVVLSISFAVFCLSSRIPVGNEKEHLMVLEKMRNEKRYDEIEDYVYRYDLYSDQYAVYLQSIKIHNTIDTFWSYKDSYENIRKEIGNGANPHPYTEEDARKKYVDMMTKAYEIFHYADEGILSENREYYQECSMEVMACLKYILGLNDEEIKKLCEYKYAYSDEFTDYCRKLYDQYSSQ